MMSRPMKNNDTDQKKDISNSSQYSLYSENNSGHKENDRLGSFEILEKNNDFEEIEYENASFKGKRSEYPSDFTRSEYNDTLFENQRFIPVLNNSPYNFPYQDMNRNYRSLTRMSCPTYHELVGDTNDLGQLKNAWKKERNRLAAKKSRDKKAIHLRHLENKEKFLNRNIEIFNEAVQDYDTFLHELLRFIENMLCKTNNGPNDALIMLFDCLCRLKKNNFDEQIYFKDVSMLIQDRKLLVTNERVEELTLRIRRFLNEMLFKQNGD